MLAVAAGLLLACMVVFPGEAAQAATRGLRIWADAVLPALFPYMVCCQILSASGALEGIGAPLERPMRRLFGCPGEAAPLALLGLLGGSPAGARMIATRRAEGGLSEAQAGRLARLTGTISPMFLLGALPGWAGLPGVGWLLLVTHWTGAIIAGAACAGRRAHVDMNRNAAPTRAPRRRRSTLGEAVSSAAQAQLAVGGCIVLGTVAADMLARLLPFAPAPLAVALHAALEMAGGSAGIVALGLPARTMVAALAAAAAFGGLSILAQNLTFLSAAGVRAPGLIGARCLHAAISAALAWALAPRALPAARLSPGAPLRLSPVGGLWLCAAPLLLLAWEKARKKGSRRSV